MRRFEYVKRFREVVELPDKNGTKIMKGYLVGLHLPKRSTSKSAGYDFYVPEDTVCKAHEITMVKTGVKAYMEDDETLLLFNRSSNPHKNGLIILNGVGVVDSDYVDSPDNEGEIAGLFYNMRDQDVVLEAGQKMMQGVFVKYGITDDDKAAGERIGGFGSTGK